VITGTVDPVLFPDGYICDEATDDANVLACPGLFVAVYKDGASMDEAPLTTANVEQFLKTSPYEYRYTVGFLSAGVYDLDLTLDKNILSEADDKTVISGGNTIVDFSVPVAD
jgi:hypothetical protein